MLGLPIVAKPQWPLPAEGEEGWVSRNVAVGVGPMHCFIATRRALIRASTKVAHTGGRISFLQLRSGRGWVPEFEPATGERLVAIQPDGIGRRRTWSYRYLRKPGADPVQIRAGPWLATFPHGAGAAQRTGFNLKSGDHIIDERVILSTMVPRALWDLAHGRTPSAAEADSAAEAEAEASAPTDERAGVDDTGADATGAAPSAAGGAAEGVGVALAPAAAFDAAARPHDVGAIDGPQALAASANAAAAPSATTTEALLDDLDDLFPPAELRATPSPSGVTAIPSVASGVEASGATSGDEAKTAPARSAGAARHTHTVPGAHSETRAVAPKDARAVSGGELLLDAIPARWVGDEESSEVDGFEGRAFAPPGPSPQLGRAYGPSPSMDHARDPSSSPLPARGPSLSPARSPALPPIPTKLPDPFADSLALLSHHTMVECTVVFLHLASGEGWVPDVDSLDGSRLLELRPSPKLLRLRVLLPQLADEASAEGAAEEGEKKQPEAHKAQVPEDSAGRTSGKVAEGAAVEDAATALLLPSSASLMSTSASLSEKNDAAADDDSEAKSSGSSGDGVEDSSTSVATGTDEAESSAGVPLLGASAARSTDAARSAAVASEASKTAEKAVHPIVRWKKSVDAKRAHDAEIKAIRALWTRMRLNGDADAMASASRSAIDNSLQRGVCGGQFELAMDQHAFDEVDAAAEEVELQRHSREKAREKQAELVKRKLERAAAAGERTAHDRANELWVYSQPARTRMLFCEEGTGNEGVIKAKHSYREKHWNKEAPWPLVPSLQFQLPEGESAHKQKAHLTREGSIAWILESERDLKVRGPLATGRRTRRQRVALRPLRSTRGVASRSLCSSLRSLPPHTHTRTRTHTLICPRQRTLSSLQCPRPRAACASRSPRRKSGRT